MSGRILSAQRANYEVDILALTNQAVTVDSPDFENLGGDGIHLDINISAISGTSPTLTVTLQGKDPISGQYYTILASSALNSTGFTRLTVFPGATVTANVSANDFLPKSWRVDAAIGGTLPRVTATIAAAVRGCA